MKFQFKEEKSFEDRQAEATKVLDLYPNRIPVIVEKWPQSRLPSLSNKKFLVEKDSSAAQL
jgi:GABA(A) receptor-associated protein